MTVCRRVCVFPVPACVCLPVSAGEAVTPTGEVHPDHAVGVAMGKRYIDEAETLEVLCVKSGDGSLAANGTLLLQKDTKKLPKTD